MKHLPIVPLVATGSHLKQGLPMRKILSLCLAVILMAGCESDFDKCMRTELPRSLSDLRVEDSRQTLAKLNTTFKKNEIALSVEESSIAWVETNPEPAGSPEWPEYEPPSVHDNFGAFMAYVDQYADKKEEYNVARKAWQELPEFIAYEKRRDAAFLKIIQETAAPVETARDYEKWLDYDSIDKVLMPRAERNGCWGEDRCEKPLVHEWRFRMTQDNYDSKTESLYSPWTIKIALTESIEWQTEELARLEKLAPETAIRACNANGFYE